MALTIITVAISRLHLPVPIAVTVALLVAIIKGSLVACYFMHLISEKKLIYAVLALTVVFFVALLGLPSRRPSRFPQPRPPFRGRPAARRCRRSRPRCDLLRAPSSRRAPSPRATGLNSKSPCRDLGVQLDTPSATPATLIAAHRETQRTRKPRQTRGSGRRHPGSRDDLHEDSSGDEPLDSWSRCSPRVGRSPPL